jgi:hypothetical protein
MEERRIGYFPDVEYEQPLEELINGVFQNSQHEPIPVLNEALAVKNDDDGNPLMEQPPWNQDLSRIEMLHAIREPIYEVERRAHDQNIQLRERYTQISQDVELLTHNFLVGTQRTRAFEGDVAYAGINQRAMNDRFDAQLRRHHEDQRQIMDIITRGRAQAGPETRPQPQARQQGQILSANETIGSGGANRFNSTGRGNTTRVGDQTLFESAGIMGMGQSDRDFKNGIEGILAKLPKAAAKKIQDLLDLTPVFEEIGANTKNLIRTEMEKIAGKHGAIMAQNQRKSLVSRKFLSKIKMNCRNIEEALEDVAIGIEDPLERISRLKQCLYYMQNNYSQNDDRQENISEALHKLQNDNEVLKEANKKKDSISITKLDHRALKNNPGYVPAPSTGTGTENFVFNKTTYLSLDNKKIGTGYEQGVNTNPKYAMKVLYNHIIDNDLNETCSLHFIKAYMTTKMQKIIQSREDFGRTFEEIWYDVQGVTKPRINRGDLNSKINDLLKTPPVDLNQVINEIQFFRTQLHENDPIETKKEVMSMEYHRDLQTLVRKYYPAYESVIDQEVSQKIAQIRSSGGVLQITQIYLDTFQETVRNAIPLGKLETMELNLRDESSPCEAQSGEKGTLTVNHVEEISDRDWRQTLDQRIEKMSTQMVEMYNTNQLDRRDRTMNNPPQGYTGQNRFPAPPVTDQNRTGNGGGGPAKQMEWRGQSDEKSTGRCQLCGMGNHEHPKCKRYEGVIPTNQRCETCPGFHPQTKACWMTQKAKNPNYDQPMQK